MKKNNFLNGLKSGIPIGLGYFSVSFTFGIMAIVSGLNWWQATIISMVTLTSAGQVAGVGVMGMPGMYIDMLVSQLTINMRYAFIEGTRKYQYNINVNSEIIDFALSLNYFIKNNKTNISRLEFQNVKNRLFAIAIGRLCNEHDIDYAISEVTDELDLSETNIKKF